jgi:hypothetical protein
MLPIPQHFQGINHKCGPVLPRLFIEPSALNAARWTLSLIAFVHATGEFRGLRIVARKSYGRIAMDSCLVAQCSNGLCLAALKTTAYTCPVGVLASCVESPIRTAPFRNFETAALCCCASANVVVHVIGCEKFHRVSSKLPFVLFAPLRDLDYSFRKNLAHCTRVSRASKSAARFLNPVPSDIQCRCKHLNSLGIKSCLWVNKLSCFDHRMPHLSQVPGARRFDGRGCRFPLPGGTMAHGTPQRAATLWLATWQGHRFARKVNRGADRRPSPNRRTLCAPGRDFVPNCHLCPNPPTVPPDLVWQDRITSSPNAHSL